MNRRRFLSALASLGVASTTKYFLPPIGGWHSDVIFNPGNLNLRFHAVVSSYRGTRYYELKRPNLRSLIFTGDAEAVTYIEAHIKPYGCTVSLIPERYYQ